MEEKELFEHYEHQVWEFTPFFKKIIGASVLINLLGLFTIAQLNIFTTRGCDTPYVGAVCQVLDSAYVASVFFGKGAEWESRPYTPTEIGEDEVTIINVGDRLEYPEGYFYKDEVAEVFPVNEFGNPTSGDPLPTTPQKPENDMGVQVLPTPNEKNEKQKYPDKPFDFEGNKDFVYKNPQKTNPPNKGKKDGIMSNESPKGLPGDDKVAVTKPTPKPTPSPTPDAKTREDAKNDFAKGFNKKPLQDFVNDKLIPKIDSTNPQEKVDLKQSFKVVLDGTLTEEGTFDPKKTNFSKDPLPGNPQMVKVAEDAIKALGDSTLFSYLKGLGVDKVNIILVQDDKKISAVIKSTVMNEQKARTISSGFNGLIVLANLNTKDDAEVQALLKGVKFKSEGKNFVINFEMPKDEAHQLIDKKLQEAREKKSQTNNVEVEKNATSSVK